MSSGMFCYVGGIAMDIKEMRELFKHKRATARCKGCKALSEELIPGEMPRVVCGKDETIATCGGPYMSFESLFDSV